MSFSNGIYLARRIHLYLLDGPFFSHLFVEDNFSFVSYLLLLVKLLLDSLAYLIVLISDRDVLGRVQPLNLDDLLPHGLLLEGHLLLVALFEVTQHIDLRVPAQLVNQAEFAHFFRPFAHPFGFLDSPILFVFSLVLVHSFYLI